jgi:tRNA threonylcarbamoyladenosine biosynthesis protein TsaE
MVKKSSFKISTKSDKETKKLGEFLAGWFIKNNKSTILSLSGDLGAGKTVFIKGLAKGLGIKKTILSPSFVLLRSYKGNSGWQLDHIDAYRLLPKDAKIFDFNKIKQPKTIIAVEWPEKISKALPKSLFKIKINHSTSETRTLELPIILKTHVSRLIN